MATDGIENETIAPGSGDTIDNFLSGSKEREDMKARLDAFFAEEDEQVVATPAKAPTKAEIDAFLGDTEERPLTYLELRREEYEKLPFLGKVQSAFTEIAQGVAFGDNIIANTIRLMQDSPQEGETEAMFDKRLQVEASIRDTTILSSGYQTAGSVIADVGLGVAVAPLVGLTLPALALEGAAFAATSGALSRAAGGEESGVAEVATDAAIGATLGAVAFGAVKVGSAIWKRASEKHGMTPQEVLEAKGKQGSLSAIKSNKRAKAVEDAVKREAKAVAAEAEDLFKRGQPPTEAMEQAAANRGLFERFGVSEELLASRGAKGARKAAKAQVRLTARKETVVGRAEEWVDEVIGQINTRVSMYDYKLGNALMRSEVDIQVGIGQAQKAHTALQKSLKSLKAEDKEVVEFLTLSKGPDAGIARLREIGSNDALAVVDRMLDAQLIIRRIGDDLLTGSGAKRLPEGEYWPRTHTKSTYQDLDADLMGGLTEVSPLIPSALRKTSNLKERTNTRIGWSQRKDYLGIADSFFTMAEAGLRSNARRKFFGTDLGAGGKVELADFNTTVSSGISALVAREVRGGRLPEDATVAVEGLLHSRFIAGEIPDDDAVKVAKGITQAGLLGQFDTAFIQLSDLANVTAQRGVINIFKGIFTKLPGELNADAVGGGNRIVMELSGEQRSNTSGVQYLSKAVQTVFRMTGLSKLDRVMTTVGLKAGASQIRTQLKTPKGTADFINDHAGFATPEEIAELIPRLKKGVVDKDTLGFYLLKQLEIKPLVKAQTTQSFTKPAGFNRLVAAIKSFTIHQLGITRKRVWDEAQDGSKAVAAKNAVALAAAWMVIGTPVTAAIGYVKGEDVEITDEMMDNLLVTMGLSLYTVQKSESDGAPGFVAAVAGFGPLSYLTRVWEDTSQSINEQGNYRWTRNIPVVGELLEAALGGREAVQVREAKRARRDELDDLLAQPDFFEKRALKREAREAEALRFL